MKDQKARTAGLKIIALIKKTDSNKYKTKEMTFVMNFLRIHLQMIFQIIKIAKIKEAFKTNISTIH